MRMVKPDFDRIFRDYQPKVRRYVSRLVGESEADDVTQEAFLKISQGLKRFQGRSKLSTWIYRIATNACLDRLRSPSFHLSRAATRSLSGSEEKTEADAHQTPPAGEPAPPEKGILREEMEACFMDIVRKMSKNDQAIILLNVLEELPNTQVSAILDLPLETVKIRLHRARARLRRELEAHCGFCRDARNMLTWDGRIF